MSSDTPQRDRIEQSPARQSFKRVRCPERDGEPRPSFLCRSVCADTSWSDDKAEEVRSQCPVYQRLREEFD